MGVKLRWWRAGALSPPRMAKGCAGIGCGMGSPLLQYVRGNTASKNGNYVQNLALLGKITLFWFKTKCNFDTDFWPQMRQKLALYTSKVGSNTILRPLLETVGVNLHPWPRVSAVSGLCPLSRKASYYLGTAPVNSIECGWIPDSWQLSEHYTCCCWCCNRWWRYNISMFVRSVTICRRWSYRMNARLWRDFVKTTSGMRSRSTTFLMTSVCFLWMRHTLFSVDSKCRKWKGRHVGLSNDYFFRVYSGK